MVHWTQNSHRRGLTIDYRRWAVIEVAKRCGVHEDTAFYYTRLDGWEMKGKSSAPRTLPSGIDLNRFLSIVACAEWRDLSVEQAKEVARVAGISDDGKSRWMKTKAPTRTVRDVTKAGWLQGRLRSY